MNENEYLIWLKGFASAIDSAPTPEQWKKIVDELDKVFVKVTPNIEPRPIFPVTPSSPITDPWEAPWTSPNPWPNRPYVTYCGNLTGFEGVIRTNISC